MYNYNYDNDDKLKHINDFLKAVINWKLSELLDIIERITQIILIGNICATNKFKGLIENTKNGTLVINLNKIIK